MNTDTRTAERAEDALHQDRRFAAIRAALGRRSIVLVGFMGSGKSSTGRRLAQRLGLAFVDADSEIETAAGMAIADIFAQHGEVHFRDGERRIMARLLDEGPRVIATGGGAFMNEETRAKIAERGISVWLKADLDVLWRRVRKRSHRPLLRGADAEQTMRALLEQRYPVYAQADLTVMSRDGPHELAVEDILSALERHLQPAGCPDQGVMNEQDQVFARRAAANGAGGGRAEVAVKLGPRSYEILIGAGLAGEIGTHLRRIAPGAACAIVTDENVARLHLPAVEAALDAAGVRRSKVVVSAGEASKSFETFAYVCDELLAARLERGDMVIALGGGVIGDLTGFAAATIRRGMRFIQMPTTLLAAVDSSVGGKTGINSRHGKNLLGAFHQPSLVLADTDLLASLPAREFRAGYAEVVKYGLIGDRDFYDWLEANWRAVFSGGAERVHAIATSCAAKAAIVARDEHEQGERALLNFGHTFGHAFERLAHYDGSRLVHGEGVAVGMACAMRFSVRAGLCSRQDQVRVESHLREVGLPAQIADIPGWSGGADEIIEAMRQDKKVERGALTFILARAIGDCFVTKSVDESDVRSFLHDELNTGH